MCMMHYRLITLCSSFIVRYKASLQNLALQMYVYILFVLHVTRGARLIPFQTAI